MTGSRARLVGVLCLELLTQRREPLTVLYALVLGLLAAAFAAAGPVELVRGRGAVPRDAAWSLMLASTALTAFGQVITTMVAATVVLRDRQDRVSALLACSRLTARDYLLGKLGAALVVLAVLYAAIPAGLVAGAVLGGGAVGASAWRAIPPFLLVVLPTMLAVGMLQFAAGVLSGRLWVIVGQGLLLIWMWSAVVDVAGAEATSSLLLVADPFGSAPLLHATRHWSDAERSVRAMPVTWPLVAGRLLWLTLGAVLASWAVRRGTVFPAPARETVAPRTASHAAPIRGLHGAPRASAWRGGVATLAYVCRWMLRDTGWRVLTVLGATNVAVHAYLDAGSGGVSVDVASVALHAVQLHARLFLILLATIYAGELVWREREERSAALFDALPLPTPARVLGGLVGVMVAQAAVVSVVGAVAGAAALAGGASPHSLPLLAVGVARDVFAPFALWMLLSAAVHATVQQKVAAHLLCIAGWVVAVLVAGAASPATGALPLRAGVVLGAGAVALTTWRWRRGVLQGRGPVVSTIQ